MSGTINIEGIDKAELLAGLYNNAKVQGLGFLQATSGDLSINDAKALLKEATRFDYLNGRVMKIDIGRDEMYVSGYDRDNGLGAASRVVDEILERMTDPGASK
jgi:hypothetical protein